MRATIITILILVILSSCKKDKDNQPPKNDGDTNIPTFLTFNGHIGTNDNSTLISYDSNLVICGYSDTNICILKISKSGNQIWRKDIYAGYNCQASAISESLNHDLYICGRTSRNYSISSYDVLLIKTNSIGDTIWTKTYGSKKEDYGFQIINTKDGNFLIGGISYSDTTTAFCDIYLIKVNTNGDTIWTRTYPDSDQEIPFHLLETQNGEYLVTGTNEDNSQPRELYFLKVSGNGTKLWDKKIGPATWKWGYSTIELPNGDLLTCGQHTTNGYSQVLLLKTDDLGNEYWEKELGATDLSEIGNSIKQNADGTFFITGASYNVSTMYYEIILLKVDPNGNQLLLKKIGSSSNSNGLNLLKDINDDNIITGNLNGSIFMTKTDNKGYFK
ncbi:MAG: hypothetical protein PHD97_08245 [Bacteroidales bacterium]|nr:hypothetical protein [Bacteroidales bacterium]